MTDDSRTVEVYADAEALAAAAARRFVEQARRAVALRNRFCVALAGGSTPQALYRRLALPAVAQEVDWQRVHVFWGDERNVPPDHADSNFRLAAETLLNRVAIPSRNIHPMRGGQDPRAAAEDYETVLKEAFDDTALRFDLMLLGLGSDGHTASLFPESDVVRATASQGVSRWVAAAYIEKLAAWRITLTPEAINRAALTIFLVTGTAKAAAVRQVLQGPHAPEALPAQLIRPVEGRLIWMLDAPAAQGLDPSPAAKA